MEKMRLRNILICALVLAVLLLGGAWLLLPRAPLTEAQRESNCVDDFHQFFRAGGLALNEGVTWVEFEANTLARCRCFAREAGRQWSPEELAILDRRESTPAIDAKRVEIFKRCHETP